MLVPVGRVQRDPDLGITYGRAIDTGVLRPHRAEQGAIDSGDASEQDWVAIDIHEHEQMTHGGHGAGRALDDPGQGEGAAFVTRTDQLKDLQGTVGIETDPADFQLFVGQMLIRQSCTGSAHEPCYGFGGRQLGWSRQIHVRFPRCFRYLGIDSTRGLHMKKVIRRRQALFQRLRASITLLLASITLPMSTMIAWAGPAYEFTRPELESIRDDLIAWLPGSWDSYPQLHFQRRVMTPAEGEHPHWHRTFARIDAPQIGELVFYGQINLGGRDGPLMHRSQILYKVWLDEERDAVVINGQMPLDPAAAVNLHEKPELWSQVQMRDESAIRCDFLWRRDGAQIVGVLDAKVEAGRKGGPGTCSYRVGDTDVEFFADAEWVLGPEDYWDYDINIMAGHQFVGRADRTHIKLYRVQDYRCEVADQSPRREWPAHNRGAKLRVVGTSGPLQLMLLRAPMPDAQGRGMHDRLRLMLQPMGVEMPVHEVEAPAKADLIRLQHAGIEVTCRATP